jgi:hypothetical protein
MPSKLSIHLNAYPNRVYDVIARMQPSAVKVFNQSSEMNIDAIRAHSPNTIIIYRQYTNLDYHSPADAFFAEIGDTLNKLRGRGILWEGINEPVVNSPDDARALNAWYVRFAELMHAQGEMVAGFCWSTGNPVDFGAVVPHIVEAAAAADVHALHEYYSTWGGEKDWCRYRAFEAALPTHARKPVVITEAGLDDNGDPHTGGYRGKKSYQEYIEILKRYDTLLLQDPYVLGATVYQWGDGSWPSFELAPMIDRLADYVASVGGGAVISKPWPTPGGPQPPPTPTYSFSVSPETITAGQSATLRWDVEGVRAAYLDGQGVAGHGVRVVTPAQTTTYTLRIVFTDNSTKELTATLTVRAAVSYSFSVTPTTITTGQSATLNWDVEGVRAIYLDGQSVAGHGSRIVAPTQTTTYTLRIVFLDGSTKDLTARVTVTTSPTPPLEWDARLDDLGVQLKRTSAPRAWRLISAKYQGPGESGGKHHVYFKALRADGTPARDVKFVVDWVNRDPSDAPAVVTTDAQGEANCPLWAILHPALKDGPYFVLPKTDPGDTVSGLGLPDNQKVNFILTFRYE